MGRRCRWPWACREPWTVVTSNISARDREHTAEASSVAGSLGTMPFGQELAGYHAGEKGGAMPPRGVKKGSKRARQYEHIKSGLKKRGTSENRAEEIAARTVQKERARHGEAR